MNNTLTSSITQTATDIRSEVADLNNNLTSKINQTASSISSEVANLNSNLTSKITQTEQSLTAKFDDGYSQGVTTINKDGIKVSQSNYSGYTQMKADGFYVNNGTENVVSITKNGAVFKGIMNMTGGSITGTTIDGGLIKTGTVDADRIKANSITASQIASGAISTDELAANAVTAAKIKANTITADQIASNTITANQIAANAITASELAADAVTAGKIKAGAITTNHLAANAITSEKISANAINGKNITGGTITGTTINNGNGTFSVNSSGALVASNATITGKITATSGSFSGSINATSGTFKGTVSGSTITGGSISGTSINNGNGSFTVDTSGNMYCSKGTFSGSINTDEIIYAKGGIYTHQDIRGLDNSTKTGGLTLVAGGGHVAVRTEDAAHSVYIQPASGEAKVTYPKKPSNYANLRAYNLIANNAVYANGVNVSSDKERKRDIELYEVDALNEICTTPVYTYHLDTDLDEEIKRIGIIMQEAPLDAIDLSGKGVDLYQMVTMLWKATQQLEARIKELENK